MITPYAKAITYFMLGHPDAQSFGRKFKISFSGCKENACALARLHDFGAIAATREENGKTRRGFELWVGGGLGPVPQQARLYDEFVPEEEILPIAQAIARVFARLGEKKNRNTALLKFLVSKLGIDEFKKLVAAERRNSSIRFALDRLPQRRRRLQRRAAETRRAPANRPAAPGRFSPSGTGITSTSNGSRATQPLRSRFRWATSQPLSCVHWPTFPANT